MATRRIGFLGFEGVQALDLVGPSDAFASDALRVADYAVDGEPPYAVVIIGLRSERFASSSGIQFRAHHVVPTSVRLDTLIVPGGRGLRKAGLADEAAAWISARAPNIRRIASVCTGIYGLAPTGLLDGRVVTTHWSHAADVQRRFPKLRVDSDALYHKDEKFSTAAGVTAGVDLALAMIEDDLGPEAALAVAREMVVYVKRSGGQHQYSEPLRFQVQATDRFADLAAWIPTHLKSDLSVEALAERAYLSVRQFTRAFRDRFDTTPAAFVEETRLTEACRRLALRRATVESVARSVGYASDDAFRRAFARRFGVVPRDYRSRFNLTGKPAI